MLPLLILFLYCSCTVFILFLYCYAVRVERFSPTVVPHLYLVLVSACGAGLVTFRGGKGNNVTPKREGIGKVGIS